MWLFWIYNKTNTALKECFNNLSLVKQWLDVVLKWQLHTILMRFPSTGMLTMLTDNHKVNLSPTNNTTFQFGSRTIIYTNYEKRQLYNHSYIVKFWELKLIILRLLTYFTTTIYVHNNVDLAAEWYTYVVTSLHT